MRYVNLTPHTVVLLNEQNDVAEVVPSTGLASVAPITKAMPSLSSANGNVPLALVGFGAVSGIPAPQDGVLYIVSALVAGRAGRDDVASPGQCPVGGHKGCPACRDEQGKQKACHGLALPL